MTARSDARRVLVWGPPPQLKFKRAFGRVRGALALAFMVVSLGASAARLANPSFDGNATGWTLWQCAYDATVSCDGVGGSLRFDRAVNEEVGQGQALAHCLIELIAPAMNYCESAA